MRNRFTWPLSLILCCVLLNSSALLSSAQQPGGGRLTGDIVGGAALIFRKPTLLDPKVNSSGSQTGVGGGSTTGRRKRKPTVAEQQEQLLLSANKARKGNQRAKAQEQYTKATLLMPTDARAFAGLGNVAVDDGKFPEAENNYKEALKLNPKYQDAKLPLAYSLAQQKKYQEAIEIYQLLKKEDPKNPEVANNLSAAYNALDQKEQYEKARVEADLAITLLGDTGQAFLQGHQDRNELLSYAYKNRGIALNGLGDPKSAAKDLREAIRLGSGNASAYFNLGQALHKIGLYSEAIGVFQEFVKLRPKVPQGLYSLAITFLAINDKESARKQYEELKAIKSDVEAARLAAELERLLK